MCSECRLRSLAENLGADWRQLKFRVIFQIFPTWMSLFAVSRNTFCLELFDPYPDLTKSSAFDRGSEPGWFSVLSSCQTSSRVERTTLLASSSVPAFQNQEVLYIPSLQPQPGATGKQHLIPLARRIEAGATNHKHNNALNATRPNAEAPPTFW